MADVIEVPLEDAKKAIVKVIEEIDKDDQLKYSTVWIKANGKSKMVKSMTVEIIKQRGGDKNE